MPTVRDMTYADFLKSKTRAAPLDGIEAPDLNPHLLPFQRDITTWALRKGRAALFADCGLGKTIMQLEWARVVAERYGPVLILAPLAVSGQTVREGEKFGIKVYWAMEQNESGEGITVTNYERLERFDPSRYAGIVLDESSILKAYDGATRTHIIESFQQTRFRLACTATPAPNDVMELGNHAEFLGVLTRTEMLAMYFCHDGGETQKWRLKGHAEDAFWRWVSSWAVKIRKPSEIGHDDTGFELPPCTFHESVIEASVEGAQEAGLLFPVAARTLVERRQAKRATLSERAEQCAGIVNASDEPWIVWCNLNAEADALAERIPDAVEIRGSDDPDDKAQRMLDFAAGKIRVLVTKPSIAGFGMNWQHCARIAFVGLSDSYEQFYQAIRRCWRFGQKREVEVHVFTSELESAIVKNIRRKEQEAQAMAEGMEGHMNELMREEIRGHGHVDIAQNLGASICGEGWQMRLGDCVEAIRQVDDDSIGYSIFSPPFASLYTYSASERDFGNCLTHDEFHEHMGFLIPELLRVTKPGRLLSFHCMNLPTSKVRDGVIGITDFRGDLIRAFRAAGWIYHSEVVIWQDPVTAMQRTKALGLLHKQLKKDSCMSRQGIPGYVVTMRKPGDNPERVEHTNESFPVDLWQRYASPVWMDIVPSNTLQRESAREEKDERHICPLQLEVIERALRLWTNPGDVVLSPFAGIGSEGYVALLQGRRFLGMELKESYFEQACANLAAAVAIRRQSDNDLFQEGKQS